MRVKLPGTHRVEKKLAAGRAAIYWYVCRGGPQLARFEGRSFAEARELERNGAVSLAAAFAEAKTRPLRTALVIADLIERYRAAPEFRQLLAPSTQAQWTRVLDDIRARFGAMELKALKARGARDVFCRWRDEYAATPRSADYRIQVLKRLLSFGVNRGIAEANPAEGIESIYRNNRADQVVSEAELSAILLHATPKAQQAIRLAAATGMRRGDLVALRWEHVLETTIELVTSKSRGKRHVRIPILPEARGVIAELRAERQALIAANAVPSAFVLTTEKRTPWKPDSVTQAFIRACAAAGVTDKHLHDLRGTFATRLAASGVSNDELADILGWESTRVAEIKKRYVHTGLIAGSIAKRVAGVGHESSGQSRSDPFRLRH